MTGLALQANSHTLASLPPPEQAELLGHLTDMALVSLAGNLRSFEITDHTGHRVTGDRLMHHLISIQAVLGQ